MSKIIFGTGKLGRINSKSYEKSLIKTLGIALKKNIDIHLSPTYGNSLKKIRENFYPLSQFDSNFIIKLDASYLNYIEYQILLTKRILGISGPVDIQLTGNLKLRNASFSNIYKKINQLSEKKIIKMCYFTPLYSDTENFEFLLDYDKIGFCLHLSLVEREFKKSFFKKIKNKSKIKIISLRSFGEGVDNYGNWNYPVYLEKKSNSLYKLQRKQYNILCNHIGIKKEEARLIYVLHHPNISKTIFTFSNELQLEQALNIEKKNITKKTWNNLDKYSCAFSNRGRRNVGSVQKPNLNFIYNHDFLASLIIAYQTQLLRFFIQNIYKRIINTIISKLISIRQFFKEFKNA